MAQEIIYTSAPQGLRPGTYGFCTVAATAGMVASFIEKLEALSGYRHLFPPGTAEASRNPVVYSHVVLKISARQVHVMSRIADAGLDYSQRSNKLAHHVALDDNETPAGGPAWLARQPGFLVGSWTGSPRTLPSPRRVAMGMLSPQVCHTWERMTGDAGWAGILAQHAYDARRPAYVIVPEGADALTLLCEAQALLPERKRWDVSFSTCYTKMPAGVDCLWRCVIAGTPEAEAALALRGDLVIDASHHLGPAPDGRLVTAARTGQVTLEPVRAATILTERTGEAEPVVRPIRPTVVQALADDEEPALTPPPMHGRSAPPIPPPKTVAPPALKRRRPWLAIASVAGMLLVLAGSGVAVYFLIKPVGMDVPLLAKAPSKNDPTNVASAEVSKINSQKAATSKNKAVPDKAATKEGEVPNVKPEPKQDEEHAQESATSPPAPDMQPTPQEDQGTEPPEQANTNVKVPTSRSSQHSTKSSSHNDTNVAASAPAQVPPAQNNSKSASVSLKSNNLTDLFKEYPLVGPLPEPESTLGNGQKPTVLWTLPADKQVLALRILGPTSDKQIFKVVKTAPFLWSVMRLQLADSEEVGVFEQQADSVCTMQFTWTTSARNGDPLGEQLRSCVLEAEFEGATIAFLLGRPKVDDPVSLTRHMFVKRDLKDQGDQLLVVDAIDAVALDKQQYWLRESECYCSKWPNIGVSVKMKAVGGRFRQSEIALSFFDNNGQFKFTAKDEFGEAGELANALSTYNRKVDERKEITARIEQLQQQLAMAKNDNMSKSLSMQIEIENRLLSEVSEAIKIVEGKYKFLAVPEIRKALKDFIDKWLTKEKGNKLPEMSCTAYKLLRHPDEPKTFLVPIRTYGTPTLSLPVMSHAKAL